MHDQLTLQINKVNISVDRDRLKYDQNERGKIVDVTVLDTDGLKAYDLTGKNIRFFDLKQGTPPKIISDDGSTSTGGKFIRTPENDKLGKFSYQFQEFTYQQSGEAHFEFYTDKDHVDVTNNFAIDIIAEGQIAPDNSSYVSSMAELIDQLKAATDHASDSIGALTTASDVAKKAATDAIQAMRDQVATYAKQVTDAQASWIAQSKKINDDAANQLASLKTKDQNEIATIVKSIADQRDAAISDLNKKAHDQLGSIQSDYSNWKAKTVADFNSTVDPIKKSIEQNKDTLTQVNKSVTELKKQFDSVDFTKFVTSDTIKNYYTKEETDLRLAQAGYAPNLLLGTQSKPKTVEMVTWSTNADHYSIDPSIDLSGQKVTASIKLAKSTNDAMVVLEYTDSTGAWHGLWGTIIPAGTTGYSTVTQLLPAKVKTIGVRPSWTNDTAKGSCTYSEAKLAVWKSAGLPPDMTWVPNEADKANTSDVYTKEETDLRLAQAGKVKTVNGQGPDNNGNIKVPSYAPNLLLGTQSKPKTVEMVTWSTNADNYHIDSSIDLSGQTVTASIKFTKSTNDAMVVLEYTDSTGSWNFPWGTIVPAGTTGYSTVTQVLPANVKTIGVRPSWTNGNTKGSCTYSEAKLAVWKSAGLPPDMTWVPNEADKANQSDVYTKEEVNSKTSGTVVTDYAIESKTPTKETNSYTNRWLVDQNALGSFADQINQLKGRRAVDAPDFNTLTDSGVYFISGPKNGKNYPPTVNWGVLAVFNGGNNQRIMQIFSVDNGTSVFMRLYGIYGAAVWGSWNQVAWNSDINNLQKAIEAGYMKKPTVISKADYDKLSTKDPNTLYEITE